MSTSREIQRERGERQVRQQKNLTEAKAKVVSAGWGTELEIELQDDLKKRMNRRTEEMIWKNGGSSGSHHT